MDRKLITLLKKACKKLGLIADYVIDEGKDGNWYYKKWKNGDYVCWMHWEGIPTNFTSTIGGYFTYGYYFSWDLPISFPRLDYSKTATAQCGSGLTVVASGGLNDRTSRVFLHWMTNAYDVTTPHKVNMQIVGRWK